MESIFRLCDTANIQVSIYRSSNSYGGDERWNAEFEGVNPSQGQEIKATAQGLNAQAAIELAWHRFERLAKGEPMLKALIAGKAVES